MKIWKYGKLHCIMSLLIVFFYSCQSNSVPIAQGGTLDLTEWDFETRGIADLNGQWLFFPNRLLSPENFSRNIKPAGFAVFPFYFTSHTLGVTGKKMAGTGHATFRLTVKLQERPLIYSLKIPEVRSAYKLWIDKKLFAQSGLPGKSKETTAASHRLNTILIPAKNEKKHKRELSIILQIANYHTPRGGLFVPLQLGTPRQISERNTFLTGGDLFLSGSLLILSLYHLSLFLLRKRDTASHYFGLICLSFCIRTLFNGEMALFSLFGHFDWEWESKIMYFTDYIFIALLPLFFKNLYPEDFPEKPVKAFKKIMLLLPIILILTPMRFYGELDIFFQGTLVLMAIYVIYSLFKVLRKKRKEVKIILTGFILLFAAAVNEILIFNGLIKTVSLLHPALFIFILSLAYALSTRFSSAFSTEEKTSAELNKRSVELIDQVKWKDEFLAGTSYELLTPLNGIINLSNSLLDGACGTQSPFTRKNLKIIASGGKKITNQINNILDYIKLENKDLKIDKNPVDIHLITQNVLNYQQDTKQKNNLKLINAVSPSSPLIIGDETRLQQILSNLINNAIKFTRRGFIKVSAEKKENRLTVIVEDTGTGMTPEKLKDLFHPATQNGKTEEKRPALGLNITRHLIELHGGNLSADSVPGKGTRFTFSLPLYNEETSHEAAHGAVPEIQKSFPGSNETPETTTFKSQSEYTLLVADDDPENLKIITDILNLENIGFITAANGFDALEILKSGVKIDLVLLDIMMPRMTGYKACKMIRIELNRPKEDLPVILLTTKNLPRDLIAGFDAGANDFITKPCYRQELKARINFHINLAKKTVQLKNLKDKLQKEIGKKRNEIIRISRVIKKHLNYARVIQTSMLPAKESPENFFIEFFTLWSPKDTVGGDFYWFKNAGEGRALFAVADCTGHGIPGALMTMTAISVLDSITAHSEPDNPALILHKTNILMRKTLHQQDKTTISDNGMDISLCYIDKKKQILIFAGARHSLYKIEEGSVVELKGDRSSIGYKNSREDFIYKNHTISLTGRGQFYLSSDGFIHQNGTASEFPMGKKRFISFIEQCMEKPAEEQKIFLEEQLAKYMGDTPQRDDITLAGFKI